MQQREQAASWLSPNLNAKEQPGPPIQLKGIANDVAASPDSVMSVFQGVSEDGVKVLLLALEEAKRRADSEVTPGHLLLGTLLVMPTSKLMEDAGLSIDQIHRTLLDSHTTQEGSKSGEIANRSRSRPRFSSASLSIIQTARGEAHRRGGRLVRSTDLLSGLIATRDEKSFASFQSAFAKIRTHLDSSPTSPESESGVESYSPSARSHSIFPVIDLTIECSFCDRKGADLGRLVPSKERVFMCEHCVSHWHQEFRSL